MRKSVPPKMVTCENCDLLFAREHHKERPRAFCTVECYYQYKRNPKYSRNTNNNLIPSHNEDEYGRDLLDHFKLMREEHE